jgi:hypothetical protein
VFVAAELSSVFVAEASLKFTRSRMNFTPAEIIPEIPISALIVNLLATRLLSPSFASATPSASISAYLELAGS